MSQICPHCAYIRKSSDQVPDWQCPSCSRAYAKSGRESAPASQRPLPASSETRRGAGRGLMLLLISVLLLWFGRPYWQAKTAPMAMSAEAGQPEVILYATEWCGYCKMTRAFFQANGIRYTERDIEQSSSALSEHRKLGGNGVPLIVVGETLINGYNEAALRQLLKPWLKG